MVENLHRTDGLEKERFDEYQGRIRKSLTFNVARPEDAAKQPVDIVREALVREHPEISIEESRKIARQIIIAPKGTAINVGKEKPVPVEDLQFQMATSIELLNSQTTSMQEYYSWIDKGEDALTNLKDGTYTNADKEMRQSFLEPLDAREAELIMCINLYEKSGFDGAREKAKELTSKLAKLREYREKVKSAVGENQETQEQKAAREKEERERREREEAAERLKIEAARDLYRVRRRLEILQGGRTNEEHAVSNEFIKYMQAKVISPRDMRERGSRQG